MGVREWVLHRHSHHQQQGERLRVVVVGQTHAVVWGRVAVGVVVGMRVVVVGQTVVVAVGVARGEPREGVGQGVRWYHTHQHQQHPRMGRMLVQQQE